MNHQTEVSKTPDRIVAELCEILVTLVTHRDVRSVEIGANVSIVSELDLDSLRFVDLMGAIEERFGIEEFFMQSWVDAELERDGTRFTVGSLALEIQRHLQRAGLS